MVKVISHLDKLWVERMDPSQGYDKLTLFSCILNRHCAYPSMSIIYWVWLFFFNTIRVSQITREGKHVQSNVPRQLVYGTMVYVRQTIVSDASTALSRAVCIATRYSAVRRQFGANNGGLETQVISTIPLSMHSIGCCWSSLILLRDTPWFFF